MKSSQIKKIKKILIKKIKKVSEVQFDCFSYNKHFFMCYTLKLININNVRSNRLIDNI
jgi:hypothetical protein